MRRFFTRAICTAAGVRRGWNVVGSKRDTECNGDWFGANRLIRIRESNINQSKPMLALFRTLYWSHLHKQQPLNVLSICFVENRY